MQAQIVVQPLSTRRQDRPLQQLLGEMVLKHSQHSTHSEVPESKEEQTYLLALRDSADSALGITLAAWREGDGQESQKINQPLRRRPMEDSTHHTRGHRQG